MRGRCPRPFLHRTTSKGELQTQSHEIVHLPSSEDEKPVLQPPHQIVIGFDLGAESSSRSLHSQATCESPRSVLEPHNLCCRTHQRSPHSPISGLGSLLSGRPRHNPRAEGAALCLKVAFKAEEGAVSANVYRAFSKTAHVVAHDAEGAGAYSACLKRDHLACSAVHSNASTKGLPRADCAGNRQNQPWKHGPNEQNWPWNHDPRGHGCCGNITNPHCKAFLSSVCNDEETNDADDEDDDDDGADCANNQVSMFWMAPPVSDNYSQDSLSVDFLSRCFLCRRLLLRGKDIYMYRGDQAFCSQECRHQQIVVDERKERCPTAVACVSRADTHLQRVGRVTYAAVE